MSTSRDSLSEALHAWRVTPPADPDFRQRVWQRVGNRSRTTWPDYLRMHAAAWSASLVIILSVAAYGGGALARSQTRADREAIVVTYLVNLDPRVQAVLKP
jgi:hypothetical protein